MSNKKNKKKLLQAVASVGTTLQTYGDKLLCAKEETAATTTTTTTPPQDSSTKKRKRSDDIDEIVKYGGKFMKKMFPSSR